MQWVYLRSRCHSEHYEGNRLSSQVVCNKCFKKYDLNLIQVDHKVAKCLGGKNSEDNLQNLCILCHKEKSIKDVKRYAHERLPFVVFLTRSQQASFVGMLELIRQTDASFTSGDLISYCLVEAAVRASHRLDQKLPLLTKSVKLVFGE